MASITISQALRVMQQLLYKMVIVWKDWSFLQTNVCFSNAFTFFSLNLFDVPIDTSTYLNSDEKIMRCTQNIQIYNFKCMPG